MSLDTEKYSGLIPSPMQNPLRVCLLALTLPLAAQGPPANDDFNKSIKLGAIASHTAATSNLGGTTQTNENTLNGLIGATIWWEWTCPTSGWARIDTSGSAIDTVVKINSTSGLTGAMLGYNDDVRDPDVTSSLTFLATANTTYYLQIGGYRGEQGNIQLAITTGTAATPSHWPSGIIYTPGSADVTNANATLEASIAVSGSSGIQGYATLGFLRPNLSEVNPPNTSISGYSSNNTNAVVSCTIPQFSQSGSWNPLVTLTPQSGIPLLFGGTNSGRPHLLSNSMLPVLSVSNTGTSDAAAPVLTAFSISPRTVNVNNGPVPITISATITDAVSGIDQVEVWLYHPFNSAFDYQLPVSLTAGTLTNGTWTGTVSLPKEYPSETYSVNVLLKDRALNASAYGAYSTSETPGGDVSLVVNGGGSYWHWAYETIKPFSDKVDLTQDANGDGIDNLTCYAFGLDPLEFSAAAPWPVITLGTSPAALSVHYRRRLAPDSGLTYIPQFANGLTDWTAAANTPAIIGATEEWEELKVIDHETTATQTRRFARVKIEYADP